MLLRDNPALEALVIAVRDDEQRFGSWKEKAAAVLGEFLHRIPGPLPLVPLELMNECLRLMLDQNDPSHYEREKEIVLENCYRENIDDALRHMDALRLPDEVMRRILRRLAAVARAIRIASRPTRRVSKSDRRLHRAS